MTTVPKSIKKRSTFTKGNPMATAEQKILRGPNELKTVVDREIKTTESQIKKLKSELAKAKKEQKTVKAKQVEAARKAKISKAKTAKDQLKKAKTAFIKISKEVEKIQLAAEVVKKELGELKLQQKKFVALDKAIEKFEREWVKKLAKLTKTKKTKKTRRKTTRARKAA